MMQFREHDKFLDKTKSMLCPPVCTVAAYISKNVYGINYFGFQNLWRKDKLIFPALSK